MAEWPPKSHKPTSYLAVHLPWARLRRAPATRRDPLCIEHDYRELDGLGLDHFEGHSYFRLAPPRHSRRSRPGLHRYHRRQPKSGCAGMTLYQALRDCESSWPSSSAPAVVPPPVTLDGSPPPSLRPNKVLGRAGNLPYQCASS